MALGHFDLVRLRSKRLSASTACRDVDARNERWSLFASGRIYCVAGKKEVWGRLRYRDWRRDYRVVLVGRSRGQFHIIILIQTRA